MQKEKVRRISDHNEAEGSGFRAQHIKLCWLNLSRTCDDRRESIKRNHNGSRHLLAKECC